MTCQNKFCLYNNNNSYTHYFLNLDSRGVCTSFKMAAIPDEDIELYKSTYRIEENKVRLKSLNK